MLEALMEEKSLGTILMKKVEDYFRDEEHRRKFEAWYKETYGKEYQWK